MELFKAPEVNAPAEFPNEEIPALVLCAQAGDGDAFTRLFRILESKLHRQAIFLTGDEHQALDLLQETMLQTWKHLGRYDERARFATWVSSIMVHRHYDWLRRLRTGAFALLASPPEDTIAEAIPSPHESTADLDRARLLRKCLDRLPPPQRMVVYLRFYADESLEGIATIVQASPGTVKSRLFYALQRLAKMQGVKELRNE